MNQRNLIQIFKYKAKPVEEWSNARGSPCAEITGETLSLNHHRW